MALNVLNLGLYFEEYNFEKDSKIFAHNVNEYFCFHQFIQYFFVIICLNLSNFIFPFLTYELSDYNFRVFIKNLNFELIFILTVFA